MKVTVDGREVLLFPGMTVRHALLAAGRESGMAGTDVRDRWGNRLGLDGALRDGDQIVTAAAVQPGCSK